MKDRIKKIRKHFDLTQEVFATRVGIKRNAIAQYEAGNSIPTTSVMSLICKEFNVNEEWLRTGSGEMFIELDREDVLMEWIGSVLAEDNESFKKRFVSALASLDVKEWELLEEIAKKLLEEKEATPLE